MQPQYLHLAADLIQRHPYPQTLTPDIPRVLIGIAGPPGAGKTTLCAAVAAAINSQHPGSAIALPMDGYHYTRAELDKFKDPVEAHNRRGSHWTFDAPALADKLEQIKAVPRSEKAVLLPSFDHGVGDPVPDAYSVGQEVFYVLMEGNYLLMGAVEEDEDPAWQRVKNVWTERWLVEIDLDEAMERVKLRHMGTNRSEEAALARIAANDRPNGEFILRRSEPGVSLSVLSVNDTKLNEEAKALAAKSDGSRPA